MDPGSRRIVTHKMCQSTSLNTSKRRSPVAELVSIVLPTYNWAHMILPAAASCLEQTYRNIEVLVVDDGSTDAGARSAGPVPGPTILRQAAAQDRRLRSPAARVPGQEAAQLPAALNTGSPARGYPA